MVELMGLPDVAALTELAAKAGGDDAVCFVPALAGLGAPHWKDRARAALTGMSLATSCSDVARATLEAIALQICDVFSAMESDLGAPLARLSVDGGATQNDLLMQFQADLLGRPVQRLKILELSAFGAGMLAGAVSGLMDEDKVEAALESARATKSTLSWTQLGGRRSSALGTQPSNWSSIVQSSPSAFINWPLKSVAHLPVLPIDADAGVRSPVRIDAGL